VGTAWTAGDINDKREAPTPALTQILRTLTQISSLHSVLDLQMLPHSASFAQDDKSMHDDPLAKEITDGRSRLSMCPSGHPERADACGSLAISLQQSYREKGSTSLLDEAIALYHESLALRPTGHPDRAGSCNNLANALYDRYKVTGSNTLLDEAIALHREALRLWPTGHRDRAGSCSNLANALYSRYQVTGSNTLLDEAIALHREALALWPTGHSNRAHSCANLATMLHHRYKVKGSTSLLDEAIVLHREALALRPPEHPDRAISVNNLASALYDRYKVTGNNTLLDEAIALHREALACRPTRHPDRAHLCNNLASALYSRYKVTGSNTLLDEAIALYRESLALRPIGHPDRASSCGNLANALRNCYEVTHVSALLDLAIALHREDLALEPPSHPGREMACYNLVISLWYQYRQTPNISIIDEVLTLIHQTPSSTSSSDRWRFLLCLCYVHAERGSPHFSISTTTDYISQLSITYPNDIKEFMHWIPGCLTLIWSAHDTWTVSTSLSLSDVYSNLIDKLSRMTGFELDPASQLTVLQSARSFGSDACIAALMAGRPDQAIELSDHAHGMIWAQALHQRDPQLQGLPENIGFELETLLRAVSMPVTAEAPTSSAPSTRYLSREDVRHQQNNRIQTLLTEIREMPGLERFMLGSTFAQLREVACRHPVVVLVAAREQAYAIIIPNSSSESPHPLHLSVTSEWLSSLRDYAGRAGLRNGQPPHEFDEDARLTFVKRLKTRKDESITVLSELWLHVVKPVLDYLQLQVRTSHPLRYTGPLTCLL
jgi:tetratricopeptide (TPR) repeat protein